MPADEEKKPKRERNIVDQIKGTMKPPAPHITIGRNSSKSQQQPGHIQRQKRNEAMWDRTRYIQIYTFICVNNNESYN